jgi:hypothetical protein
MTSAVERKQPAQDSRSNVKMKSHPSGMLALARGNPHISGSRISNHAHGS